MMQVNELRARYDVLKRVQQLKVRNAIIAIVVLSLAAAWTVCHWLRPWL
jgi:hypothetical protein